MRTLTVVFTLVVHYLLMSGCGAPSSVPIARSDDGEDSGGEDGGSEHDAGDEPQGKRCVETSGGAIAEKWICQAVYEDVHECNVDHDCYHTVCDENAFCKQTQGSGDDECNTGAQDCPKHTECVPNEDGITASCNTVPGTAPNECQEFGRSEDCNHCDPTEGTCVAGAPDLSRGESGCNSTYGAKQCSSYTCNSRTGACMLGGGGGLPCDPLGRNQCMDSGNVGCVESPLDNNKRLCSYGAKSYEPRCSAGSIGFECLPAMVCNGTKCEPGYIGEAPLCTVTPGTLNQSPDCAGTCTDEGTCMSADPAEHIACDSDNGDFPCPKRCQTIDGQAVCAPWSEPIAPPERPGHRPKSNCGAALACPTKVCKASQVGGAWEYGCFAVDGTDDGPACMNSATCLHYVCNKGKCEAASGPGANHPDCFPNFVPDAECDPARSLFDENASAPPIELTPEVLARAKIQAGRDYLAKGGILPRPPTPPRAPTPETIAATKLATLFSALPRVELSQRKDRGPQRKTLRIVVAHDPTCGQCRRAFQELFAWWRSTKDPLKATLAFEFIPLALVPKDETTHRLNALYCAAEQGNHHGLAYLEKYYTSDYKQDDPVRADFAEELGLDMQQFTACVEQGKYLTQLGVHRKELFALNVTGTPTFLIQYRGAKQYAVAPGFPRTATAFVADLRHVIQRKGIVDRGAK